MENLITRGWNDQRRWDFERLGLLDFEPGRVLAADRGNYVVLVEDGELAATARGKLVHDAHGAVGLPAVGDWVALAREGDAGVIERVLPRSSCLIRKSAGRDYCAQVIAANLDRVFIVTAIGRDLNPRRVERYLAAVHAAGAEPVVLVNKRDLDHDRADVMAQLAPVALDVEIVMASTKEEDGLDEIEPLLLSGRTVALVGSSGVGKSSLVNRLVGFERQAVSEVRAADQKGRHATTRRELIMAPGGFMLIDTPGMREFGLWDAEAGLDATFADVVELARSCRFRDCLHQVEPGCAVRAAIDAGVLPPGRLDSYLRLVREQQNVQQRAKARDGKETKRRWKQMTKDWRQQKKINRKLGLKND